VGLRERPPPRLSDPHADLYRAPTPATPRSTFAVASPARTSSTICSIEKPCTSMIASVQPSLRRRAVRSGGRAWDGGGFAASAGERSAAFGTAPACRPKGAPPPPVPQLSTGCPPGYAMPRRPEARRRLSGGVIADVGVLRGSRVQVAVKYAQSFIRGYPAAAR